MHWPFEPQILIWNPLETLVKGCWNNFLKVIFHQKVIYRLQSESGHLYLQVTSFFIIKLFRFDLRNFIQVCMLSHLKSIIYVDVEYTLVFPSFQTWTVELCRKDSDGDGKTNGEELGDPDCVWRENAIPKTNAFSHPGIYRIFLLSPCKY